VRERTAQAWSDAVNALVAKRWPPLTIRGYAMRFGWDEIVDRQCGLLEAVVRQDRAAAHAREHAAAPADARR